MNDFNQNLIQEFRDNGGKVSGYFANTPLLLLTTRGAKSGQPRTTPLAYTTDGNRLVIIASKGGAPTNPDWFFNIQANPNITVEIGQERFEARATMTEDPERERLYDKMVEQLPGFDEYRKKTTRKIPVIALERLS
jgi:deazaflavin-dependent oxidoreductase (nitroreductase family)